MAPSSQSKSLPSGTDLYLFHHIFLPPKLPESDDYDSHYETFLLNTLFDALLAFHSHPESEDAEILRAITTMVSRLKSIRNRYGGIDEDQLTKKLAQLDEQGGLLPIYVQEQNAGILMSRHGNMIHVEAFELSPRNESAIATLGRLQRTFPGPTLGLNLNTLNEPGFREALAQTLAQMSHEPVARTKEKVWKAGQTHDEDRDTTDPKMVTEFIMATLRPRCTVLQSVQIEKNTREEVMW